MLKNMKNKNNSVLYGLTAGLALLLFYLIIVSLFQGIGFAFLNLRSLWYLILPLAIGFGVQVGLYFSIKHTALINGTAAGTAAISSGSMIACCSHFILSLIPIPGFSSAAGFLTRYQKLFLIFGIISNIIGIIIMLRHKRKMGGNCHEK